MLNLRWGAAALVILACAASACKKSSTEAPATQAQPQPGAAASTPGEPAAAVPPPEPVKPVPPTIPTVVARVNGENVAKADFDRLLKQMEMQAGQVVPAERRDEVYRAVLDQLVTYTALVQETRARGVEVTEGEATKVADARIAELRQQIPDEAAFKKALEERDMTLDRLRADIRRDIAISKMMEAALAGAPGVSDAEVRDFYDKNPDEFTGIRAKIGRAHV